MNEFPDRDLMTLLDQAYSQADTKICKMPNVSSGCTAVTCIVRPEKSKDTNEKTTQLVLYSANVGDSRAVLYRKGRPIRLTLDHKGSLQEEKDRVREAGGFIADNRVAGISKKILNSLFLSDIVFLGNLAVTRALGDVDLKDYVTGRPYTSRIVLKPIEDDLLILACDGLWDVVSDEAAGYYIGPLLAETDNYLGQKDALTEAANSLIDFALEQGSTDNVSVMLIRFH